MKSELLSHPQLRLNSVDKLADQCACVKYKNIKSLMKNRHESAPK